VTELRTLLLGLLDTLCLVKVSGELLADPLAEGLFQELAGVPA